MGIIIFLTDLYNEFVNIMPAELKIIPPLFLISMAIVFYGLFIWFFHSFLARKDLLKLNLSKYEKDEDANEKKSLAVLLYVLEFIIITPIVIFVWFTIFTLFFIIFAKDMEVGSIMLICAALISAVRITAYFKEDLSKELAKLVPLTLLAVIIATPNFFNLTTTIDRIAQIPSFFNNAFYYLFFIFIWEILLRVLSLFFLVLGINPDGEKEKKEGKKPISDYS